MKIKLSALDKFKVIRVLDPKRYGNRVYSLDGENVPERGNILLDFSALPIKTRQEELNLFHHKNDDGTLLVRIHRCKSVKRNNFPELLENERYAYQARDWTNSNRPPNNCGRCNV